MTVSSQFKVKILRQPNLKMGSRFSERLISLDIKILAVWKSKPVYIESAPRRLWDVHAQGLLGSVYRVKEQGWQEGPIVVQGMPRLTPWGALGLGGPCRDAPDQGVGPGSLFPCIRQSLAVGWGGSWGWEQVPLRDSAVSRFQKSGDGLWRQQRGPGRSPTGP